MDVRIEAEPFTVEAAMTTATVVVKVSPVSVALSRIEWFASVLRLSIGGVSLSAVSPDSYFTRGLAKAA